MEELSKSLGREKGNDVRDLSGLRGVSMVARIVPEESRKVIVPERLEIGFPRPFSPQQ